VLQSEATSWSPEVQFLPILCAVIALSLVPYLFVLPSTADSTGTQFGTCSLFFPQCPTRMH
jgi:hypothetical protein